MKGRFDDRENNMSGCIASLRKRICAIIWNLSEWSGVGLGRFAPHIFACMIECKEYKEVDK